MSWPEPAHKMDNPKRVWSKQTIKPTQVAHFSAMGTKCTDLFFLVPITFFSLSLMWNFSVNGFKGTARTRSKGRELIPNSPPILFWKKNLILFFNLKKKLGHRFCAFIISWVKRVMGWTCNLFKEIFNFNKLQLRLI